MFIRYGFKKTTVEDISRDAGIGKGTVYLHFKDKEEILAAVVLEICQDSLLRLQKTMSEASTATQALLNFFKCKCEIVNELNAKSEANWESINEAAKVPAVEKLRIDHISLERKLLEEVLAAGVKQGEFRLSNIQDVSLIIATTIDAIIASARSPGGVEFFEQRVGAFADILFQGIKLGQENVTQNNQSRLS